MFDCSFPNIRTLCIVRRLSYKENLLPFSMGKAYSLKGQELSLWRNCDAVTPSELSCSKK